MARKSAPVGCAGSKSRSISIADASAALQKVGSFPENIPLAIAWQIAQNDQGLTLLPYEERYGLAWTYQQQGIYYQDEERYLNSTLTLTKPPDGNAFFLVYNLVLQLRAVVAMEQQLDKQYTNMLARAKSEYGI